MRVHLVTLLIGLMLSACLGAWFYWLQRPQPYFDLTGRVDMLHHDLRTADPAWPSMSPGQALKFAGSSQLLDPGFALPQTFRYQAEDLRQVQLFAQRCSNPPTPLVQDGLIEKLLVFTQWQCGLQSELPETFFNTPPFMHPNGRSYAALAIEHAPQSFKTGQLMPWLHLLEWPQALVLEKLAIGEPLTLIWWEPLWQGNPAVRTDHYYLMQTPSADYQGWPSYLIVPLEHVRKLAARFDLEPGSAQATGAHCVRGTGAWCWQQRVALGSVRPEWVGGAALLTLATGLLGLFNLMRYFRRQQQAEWEARLLTLQMLAHELRTPLTGFKLNFEMLRSDLTSAGTKEPPATVERIERDLLRLERVLLASRSFLESASPENAELANHESVLFGDVWTQVIADFDGSDLGFSQLPASTLDLRVPDPWFELALRNLVQNGLDHGQGRVEIEVQHVPDKYLEIIVRDQGAGLSGGALADFKRPFVKGKQSRGLGLGLALVDAMATKMGGRLSYEPKPTRFRLTIPAT